MGEDKSPWISARNEVEPPDSGGHWMYMGMGGHMYPWGRGMRGEGGVEGGEGEEEGDGEAERETERPKLAELCTSARKGDGVGGKPL